MGLRMFTLSLALTFAPVLAKVQYAYDAYQFHSQYELDKIQPINHLTFTTTIN